MFHITAYSLFSFCRTSQMSHVMQTQQSSSSLSTPGSRWRCCLSWCWSKVHCTRPEPSGPTHGRRGQDEAGSHPIRTLVWASCRRIESKMPPHVRFSWGQTGGWHGRPWRGRRNSTPQELCTWSVPSLSCSHPVRWVKSCRSGLCRPKWGVRCGPQTVWHWRLTWGPQRTLLPAPSPLSLQGHLCPRSGLAILSHLQRKHELSVLEFIPQVQTNTKRTDHLGLPRPLSVLSPPEQHPSRPARLSLADQDCHLIQESRVYQGDQCTDWEGSCCLPTGWKDALVGGGGGRATKGAAWEMSLQCDCWEEREETWSWTDTYTSAEAHSFSWNQRAAQMKLKINVSLRTLVLIMIYFVVEYFREQCVVSCHSIAAFYWFYINILECIVITN